MSSVSVSALSTTLLSLHLATRVVGLECTPGGHPRLTRAKPCCSIGFSEPFPRRQPPSPVDPPQKSFALALAVGQPACAWATRGCEVPQALRCSVSGALSIPKRGVLCSKRTRSTAGVCPDKSIPSTRSFRERSRVLHSRENDGLVFQNVRAGKRQQTFCKVSSPNFLFQILFP
jgi:hypothetical protein